MSFTDDFISLFFATTDRVGRQLVDRPRGNNVFGPWRDRRDAETGREWSFRALTPDMIDMHLVGSLLYRGERARLQTYGVSATGESLWTAIDLDVTAGGSHTDQIQHFATTKDAVAAAQLVVDEANKSGITAWFEITKSAGIRVWTFFASPIPASDANALGQLLVTRAGLHAATEVFPNTVRPFAAPVLLPYAGVAKMGRQVMLSGERFAPMSCADFVTAALAERADPASVLAIVEQAVAAGEVKRLSVPSERDRAVVEPVTDEEAEYRWKARLTGCTRLRTMVAHAEAGKPLDYFDWATRLLSHLRSLGEWGHAEFHRLSAFDPRYNTAECEDKFNSLDGAPTRCEKMGCSLDPHRDCGLPLKNVSPAYFGASPISTTLASAISRLPVHRIFPTPDVAAYHGLAGYVVRAIEPHTEADPVALLIQFLVAFGNTVGRNAHFRAEADEHYGNLFAVLVGVSSKGRKGSSWGHVKKIFEAADPAWTQTRVVSGLSSGEGLIFNVRDAVEKQMRDKKTGATVPFVDDDGVADKRLLVLESEFASVLRQTQRDGNTLSATVRNAWDTGALQSLTKNSPARATGAHISIMGHITQDELRKELAETETANGFGNRFLWICVKRSKELPDGGRIDTVNFEEIVLRLRAAIEHARASQLLCRDATAGEIWHSVYHDLSTGKPGQRGALTGRSEAQTMRLALLFALLDGDNAIRGQHLTAALALWEYCDASVGYIFGDNLGDRVADAILHGLRNSEQGGLSREKIRDLFGRNQSSGRIDQALAVLVEYGLAAATSVPGEGPGRPAEVWKATRKTR